MTAAEIYRVIVLILAGVTGVVAFAIMLLWYWERAIGNPLRDFDINDDIGPLIEENEWNKHGTSNQEV